MPDKKDIWLTQSAYAEEVNRARAAFRRACSASPAGKRNHLETFASVLVSIHLKKHLAQVTSRDKIEEFQSNFCIVETLIEEITAFLPPEDKETFWGFVRASLDDIRAEAFQRSRIEFSEGTAAMDEIGLPAMALREISRATKPMSAKARDNNLMYVITDKTLTFLREGYNGEQVTIKVGDRPQPVPEWVRESDTFKQAVKAGGLNEVEIPTRHRTGLEKSELDQLLPGWGPQSGAGKELRWSPYLELPESAWDIVEAAELEAQSIFEEFQRDQTQLLVQASNLGVSPSDLDFAPGNAVLELSRATGNKGRYAGADYLFRATAEQFWNQLKPDVTAFVTKLDPAWRWAYRKFQITHEIPIGFRRAWRAWALRERARPSLMPEANVGASDSQQSLQGPIQPSDSSESGLDMDRHTVAVDRANVDSDALGELGTADFWHKIHDRFMELSDAERSVVPEVERDLWLRAFAYYAIAQTVPANWELRKGTNEYLLEKFQSIAARAGHALKSPRDVDPVDYWLHRLFLYLRETRSSRLWAPNEATTILCVLEASATYSLRLERDALSGFGDRIIPIRQEEIGLSRSDLSQPIVLSESASSETNSTVTAEELGLKRRSVVMPILNARRWKRGKWATAAGVGKNSVYQYLEGKRNLGDENRRAMAEALGLKPEELPK